MKACVCPLFHVSYVYFNELHLYMLLRNYVPCSQCSWSIHVCCFYLHGIPAAVMVSLCLSGVNPQHLAMIGSFLLYRNPKWRNHTLYGKQSMYGSDMHSILKPQIAPIKEFV